MQVIGPRPVITQRRCPFFVENMWLAPRFQIRFHASKGAIGNVTDKKVANDRLHHWRQGADTEVQVVCDFDENTRRRFLEGPDHEHALGESLQVMKLHLDSFAVDDLFRCPGNWNPGASGGHDHNITIRSALEILNITIMWQNLWPVFEVGSGLENFGSRRLHDN